MNVSILALGLAAAAQLPPWASAERPRRSGNHLTGEARARAFAGSVKPWGERKAAWAVVEKALGYRDEEMVRRLVFPHGGRLPAPPALRRAFKAELQLQLPCYRYPPVAQWQHRRAS